MAQKKVRFALASLAVGAMAFTTLPLQAQAAPDIIGGISIDDGWYRGRIAGADRYQTAARASQSLVGVNRNTVILANANSWSDVLAATPIADELNTTVLYTGVNSFPAHTEKELKRLKAEGRVTKVLIVGGTSVVGQGVIDQLAKVGFANTRTGWNTYTYNVDRISGGDRYETALLLATEAVDSYEGSTEVLRNARGVLSHQAFLEAEYQAALAAVEPARLAADTARATRDARLADHAAAVAALQVLTDQLVTTPDIAAKRTAAETANNEVVAANNKVADIQTLIGFVNARVSEYVVANPTDFQNKSWNTVAAWHDAQGHTFTVTLTDRPYTGTVTELSNDIALLNDAVGAAGSTNSIQAVGAKLEADLVGARDVQTGKVEAAGAANAALNKAIQDSAANEALVPKIAAAQAAVVAAQTALTKAQDALDLADAAEAAARQALHDATVRRPSTTAVNDAKKAYEKALADIIALGKKYPAFLATGRDFADALAAGPAASKEYRTSTGNRKGGVVLLTNDETVPAPTARYLATNPTKIAVGGPASRAVPTAEFSYVGADRYETATKLASAYFDRLDYVGLASGQVAADAVVGGAVMANVDSTLVLTRESSLPTATYNFLAFDTNRPTLVVFGGRSAISDSVVDEAARAVSRS